MEDNIILSNMIIINIKSIGFRVDLLFLKVVFGKFDLIFIF